MPVITKEATSVVKEYYTDYAKYVLETRALPSIYDGFKHVYRRLIYEADKLPMKLTKSANLVGNTIPLHPHSPESIYGALVSLTSPLSAFRLFKGKGNFGGIGFGAAAMRYTEAYLDNHARFGMTQFIDYADYELGESGHQEPVALPVLVPYSNVVGTSGIGVGLSTNIMPLNLIELIDYFISVIKGEDPKIPTPDLGNIILDMTNDEIDEAVSNIDGKLRVKSIITQESSNVLVIEDLFNRSIDSVLNRIGDLLDSNRVDFRDESSDRMRLVFEIMDSNVSISDLKSKLEKATQTSMTFTRLVVDGNTAVYCNLRHQVNKTLEYLNKVLDKKFSKEILKLQLNEQVLLAIEYMKTSGLVNKLGILSTDELKDELLKGNYSDEVINIAIRKPITYLTKSHVGELQDIQNQIQELQNTDRTEYLINLYTKFKELVKPVYDSKKHSIKRSQLLNTIRVKKERRSNSVLVSNSGLDFKDYIVLFTKDGKSYPMTINSSIRKSIQLDVPDVVDISTDVFEYVVLITNKEGAIAVSRDRLINGWKQLINLDDDEYVTNVLRVNGEIFNYGNIDYEVKWFIRTKVSKPRRNWRL